MIPEFSSMVIVALGMIIVTGPTLLWLLEDDLGLLGQSYYGYLIIAKISIASVMVALGGYNQFRIQRTAEKRLETGNITVHKNLKGSLRTEAVLGIILLGVVAMLTNASLPTSQAQEDTKGITYGFDTNVFSENIGFHLNIEPFRSGVNTISVSGFDSQGNTLEDLENIKVKISNPEKNIAPLEVPLTRSESQNVYEGEVTFGFSGKWDVEIEAQRTMHANEGTDLVVFVKPHVAELKTEVAEYDLPSSAAPLYPAYDGDDIIWLSDASKPRLWKFLISEKQFTPYEFEGKTSVFLKIDGEKIWFTDTPDSKIGYFDTVTQEFHLIPLPIKSIPISLETDLDGNLWVALVDQHMLLKYDPQRNQFEEHKVPTNSSGPVALTRDSNGHIWFAESQSGKIGKIEPQSGEIQEFMPESPLKEPFALFIDTDENIWIAEHVGLNIVKFNPYLSTFESVPVTDPDSLPFGMAQDKFGNIWIALHTVDKLGVYDLQKDEFSEVQIPTQSTFTQFVASDKDGNIWFVEQRSNKLGSVTISENPAITVIPEQPAAKIQYFELAAPMITAGIVSTSLFFVKSVQDRRRLGSLID
jgi:copper transport protein